MQYYLKVKCDKLNMHTVSLGSPLKLKQGKLAKEPVINKIQNTNILNQSKNRWKKKEGAMTRLNKVESNSKISNKIGYVDLPLNVLKITEYSKGLNILI